MAPHQERVVAEKRELDEKLGRLRSFFMTSMFRSLPEPERDRLRRQEAVMVAYATVLGERIGAF